MKLTNHTHKLPTEWQKIRLGDVCRIKTGHAFKSADWSESGIPVIKIGNVSNHILNYDSCNFISEKLFKSLQAVQLKENEILISLSGATLGIIHKAEKSWLPAAINQRVGFIAPDFFTDTIESFVYYYLKDCENKDALASLGYGSAQPNISPFQLENLAFPLPSLPEQKAIAEVLGSLDDKIQHNKEQNKILEETARTLFQDWFINFGPVKEKINAKKENRPENPYLKPEIWNLFPNILNDDGIPEGWEMSTIGEEVELKGGGTPSTQNAEYWGNNYFWATPKDLSSLSSPWISKTERKISTAGLKTISSGLLPAETVLLSSRAPVGYLALGRMPLAINQGFIAAICKKELPSLYIFYWMKKNIDLFKQHANGATFQEISKKAFRPLQIIKPSKKLTNLFQRQAMQLFEKIHQNEEENRHLIELRDTLLPRLISGKIRVKFQNPKN